MSTLANTMRSDLTAAIRARDTTTTAALRMTLAALSTEAVAGKAARELTDAEVLTVLGREVKKRQEAAEAFTATARPQSAATELAEAAVIESYLPTQLTDAELTELVAVVLADTGATGPRGIGTAMKALTPLVAGRATGARVSAEVRRQLT